MAQVIPVHRAIAGHLAMLEISRGMEVTPSWLPIALATGTRQHKAAQDKRGEHEDASITAMLNGHCRYRERPRLASHMTFAAQENVPTYGPRPKRG